MGYSGCMCIMYMASMSTQIHLSFGSFVFFLRVLPVFFLLPLLFINLLNISAKKSENKKKFNEKQTFAVYVA